MARISGKVIEIKMSRLVSNYQLNAHFLYSITIYEGWKFNSGNYLFTTNTK